LKKRTLSLIYVGDGKGYVSTVPSGDSKSGCKVDKCRVFDSGTQVKLVPKPAEGFQFKGWGIGQVIEIAAIIK